VLSVGQTVLAARHAAGAGHQAGEKVLDLAPARGVTLSWPLRAWCVAADFSVGMLRCGACPDVPKVAWYAPDAVRDNVVDAVTISSGYANVAERDQALREMAVTRPGGRWWCARFSTPPTECRHGHKEYLMQACRGWPGRVEQPEAYVYLAESIRAWLTRPTWPPDTAAGSSAVRWRNLTASLRYTAAYKATKSSQLNGFRGR